MEVIVNDIHFWNNKYNYPEKYVTYNQNSCDLFLPEKIFLKIFLEGATSLLQPNVSKFGCENETNSVTVPCKSSV